MKTTPRSTRAILLLEVMIGVAIFAIGVISLGNCVAECMRAEKLRMEERDVRNALQAAMAEILAGQTLPEDKKQIEVEGSDPAIVIVQSRKPLDLRNEQKVPIRGLYEISLTAKWESRGTEQEETLTFFLSREG